MRKCLVALLVAMMTSAAFGAHTKLRVYTTNADPDTNACALKSPPVILVYDNGSALEFFACTSSTWSATSTFDKASSGTAPPGSCTQGDLFVDTDGDGSILCDNGECALAICSSTDTWIYPNNFFQKSIVIDSPADADSYIWFQVPKDGLTLDRIDCIIDPADSGESVVIDVRECNGTGDSCSTVDATISCVNTGAEDDGSLTDSSLAGEAWMLLDIGAVTGTVAAVSVNIEAHH